MMKSIPLTLCAKGDSVSRDIKLKTYANRPPKNFKILRKPIKQ